MNAFAKVDVETFLLLANWGADRVIAVTGPAVWREALVAFETAEAAKPAAS